MRTYQCIATLAIAIRLPFTVHRSPKQSRRVTYLTDCNSLTRQSLFSRLSYLVASLTSVAHNCIITKLLLLCVHLSVCLSIGLPPARIRWARARSVLLCRQMPLRMLARQTSEQPIRSHQERAPERPYAPTHRCALLARLIGQLYNDI